MTHSLGSPSTYNATRLSDQLRGVAKRHYLKELTANDALEEIRALLGTKEDIDSLAGFYRRSVGRLFPDLAGPGLELPFVYSKPSNVCGPSVIQVGDVILQHRPRTTLIPTRTAYCLGEHVAGFLTDVEAPRVFEFGVGTGIIGASALRAFPGARYVGVELDPVVSEIASSSFLWNGFSPDQAEVRNGDGFSVLGGGQDFDLIVSNPPYYPRRRAHLRETRWIGPPVALDGGEDGMRFYREIFAKAGRHAKEGGHVVVQTPTNLASRVMALARSYFPASEPQANSLEPKRPHSDLAVSIQVA